MFSRHVAADCGTADAEHTGSKSSMPIFLPSSFRAFVHWQTHFLCSSHYSLFDMHHSFFNYNLTRPYPYRWFTPAALFGAIILVVLLSVSILMS
jgi:hypothetical protein